LPEAGPILLDTDVASDIMRGRIDPADGVLLNHTWCVSFVTVGEFAKGATAAGWGLRKRTQLADWLRDVVILPYDLEVSWKWGELAGAAQRRGRSQPVNDMWIASVALVNHLPLATRNVKDYAAFVEHHGLVLLSS
jgi:predicted nucleic acid-binding protein